MRSRPPAAGRVIGQVGMVLLHQPQIGSPYLLSGRGPAERRRSRSRSDLRASIRGLTTAAAAALAAAALDAVSGFG